MIHAVVTARVGATAQRVRALYLDAEGWGRVFPATIRGARVVSRSGDVMVVKVDHVEGTVLNVIHEVSPARVELEEWKRRYDATFTNEFLPDGDGGCLLRITAEVRPKGPYRLAAPFLAPLVKARLRRYVVEPLRAAAERGPGGATER